MDELNYKPVPHHHAQFLERAQKRKGFPEAYEALALEYEVVNLLLRARAKAGLTQDAVAERMGTTKSAVSRLESAGRHSPSLGTLQRYAQAVGCELQLKLVPQRTGTTSNREVQRTLDPSGRPLPRSPGRVKRR
ncbi:MAG: helix-turn-helix transcriptional regulator [Lautropia sp.]